MNNVNTSLTLRETSLDLLAPVVRNAAIVALANANADGHTVKCFESYRSPQRQNYLYAQGRTAPGAKVTNAKAWQSFHQYSLALDVVFWVGGAWSWDKSFPWDRVAQYFLNEGFERLSFERPHFQMTGGFSTTQAYDISQKQGMQALWLLVEKSHDAKFQSSLARNLSSKV